MKVLDKYGNTKTIYDTVVPPVVAGVVPVGAVIPYLGGYMTDGANGGFTMVMAGANTVAAVNALLNSSGFYVCDGAALNHASSPIWVGAGRYLYNLTDDRFLMGDTLAGGTGGSNSSAHTHVAGTLALVHTHQVNPPETESDVESTHDTSKYHSDGAYNDISGWAHKHKTDIAEFTSGAASTEAVTGSSGAASATENRPTYLGCFYIVRAF